MSSEEKWLRIHNSQEWPDYYDEMNTEDRRRFFDRYLKGANNGWEHTPRVRYSVLDMEGGDLTDLPATAFPPQDVRYIAEFDFTVKNSPVLTFLNNFLSVSVKTRHELIDVWILMYNFVVWKI